MTKTKRALPLGPAEKPRFRMINKPNRQKMFKVNAAYKFDGDQSFLLIERARFLHPGDAYNFAQQIHDIGLSGSASARALIEVNVEC